jgi:hypothetical protein
MSRGWLEEYGLGVIGVVLSVWRGLHAVSSCVTVAEGGP